MNTIGIIVLEALDFVVCVQCGHHYRVHNVDDDRRYINADQALTCWTSRKIL